MFDDFADDVGGMGRRVLGSAVGSVSEGDSNKSCAARSAIGSVDSGEWRAFVVSVTEVIKDGREEGKGKV